MFTTFFGAQSFGGDAAFVDRLSRALLLRGHSVDVVHCVDAFETVRGDHSLRPYSKPDGLRVHSLSSRWGALSPIFTHQTGRMGFKKHAIRRILAEGDYDVIHFHNISLLGAPELFRVAMGHAVRLMTAMEFWLVCPLSSLWKFDREICETPQCLRCAARAARPPQLWRSRKSINAALIGLDALITPSEHTRQTLIDRGVNVPITVLPFFASDEMLEQCQPSSARPPRPYFFAAGRLVKEKGFHDAIRLMPSIPKADLLIAGEGRHQQELQRLAAGMPNVRFIGLLDSEELRRLYHGARATVVPSAFLETFGYVALEAFAVGCPVVVPDRGALPDLVRKCGGGIVYEDNAHLLHILRDLVTNDTLRQTLGNLARDACREHWSEDSHIARYLKLIDDCDARRMPHDLCAD